ncbi:unnamed protein product, partial [Amoebophrya sp. A25]
AEVPVRRRYSEVVHTQIRTNIPEIASISVIRVESPTSSTNNKGFQVLAGIKAHAQNQREEGGSSRGLGGGQRDARDRQPSIIVEEDEE